MGDLVQLHNRCAPWAPSPDSVVVAQYRYYDVPLCGVIRQANREFLFMCLDGADETLSLWWYVALDHRQREALEAAHNDFEDTLHKMEFEGWSRLALATTDLGILDFADVEDTPDEEGMRQALRELLDRFDALSAEAHQLVLAGR